MMRFSSLAIATVAIALLTSAPVQAQSGKWVTLKGQFLYGKDGTTVPAKNAIVPDKDVQVCGKNPLFQENLVVNPKNRGLANVMIWAYKPKKIHPDLAGAPKESVKMDNLSCRFAPHAVAVRTGQTLEITNSDSVSHNSMITFMKNQAVNPMIQPKGSQKFKLAKAEIIPIKVACSIHPWMQGVILVQDHPYTAVTDADGKFEIKNLPAGKTALKVWHEGMGYVKEVVLDSKKTTWKRGKYNVQLSKDEEHTYVIDPKLFK